MSDNRLGDELRRLLDGGTLEETIDSLLLLFIWQTFLYPQKRELARVK